MPPLESAIAKHQLMIAQTEAICWLLRKVKLAKELQGSLAKKSTICIENWQPVGPSDSKFIMASLEITQLIGSWVALLIDKTSCSSLGQRQPQSTSLYTTVIHPVWTTISLGTRAGLAEGTESVQSLESFLNFVLGIQWWAKQIGSRV